MVINPTCRYERGRYRRESGWEKEIINKMVDELSKANTKQTCTHDISVVLKDDGRQ